VKHSQGTAATKRRDRLSALVLALLLLWPAPTFGRTLYRCVETGELLNACCRELPEIEKPLCCTEDLGRGEGAAAACATETEPECDCCDLLFENGERPADAKAPSSSPPPVPSPFSSAAPTAALVPHLESHDRIVTGSPRAPPGRALFQVFGVYLI
jgi:hypothetical protein